MADMIVSLIRSEITKNTTGKAIVDTSGNSFFPDRTEIRISNENITVRYYSGATIQNGPTMSQPFFGDSRYDINKVSGTQAGGVVFLPATLTGSQTSLVIELANGQEAQMYYSGATSITPLIQASMELGYEPELTTVVFDRRSRVVEQKN